MLYALGAQHFLKKWAASILLAVKWATSLRIVRKYFLPQSSVHSFFYFESRKSYLFSQRGALVQPPQGKFWENYENGKDVINQVNILCQEEIAGNTVLKFEILCQQT